MVVEPPKDVDHARQLIAKCLREKDYMTAVKLVRRIDASNREIAEMPFNDQVGYHTVLLRSYLFLEEDYVSVTNITYLFSILNSTKLTIKSNWLKDYR